MARERIYWSLREDGYILIKNALSESEIQYGKNCIRGDKVNYNVMKQFIDKVMLGRVNEIVGGRANYVKFRVSDNNNSADASTFHRDLVCQSKDPIDFDVPVYTCLTYFDTTTMEVIPKSHKRIVKGVIDVCKFMMTKESRKLVVEPGDILLFNSSLLHRGIFTEKLEHRRVVQVFDVFLTESDFMKYSDRIVHVRGREAHTKMMVEVSKIPLFIDTLNMVGLYNAASGYGWSEENNVIDACGLSENIKYISSEGLRGRLEIRPNELQEINKYIINTKTIDLDDNYYDTYNYMSYTRQYILITLIWLVMVISLYKLIMTQIRRK